MRLTGFLRLRLGHPPPSPLHSTLPVLHARGVARRPKLLALQTPPLRSVPRHLRERPVVLPPPCHTRRRVARRECSEHGVDEAHSRRLMTGLIHWVEASFTDYYLESTL